MLPLNFHQTFVPERRFIAALLDYAALGKKGDFQSISADTGIPMGESSGKVPAILNYAQGMGLVEINKLDGGMIKKPVLTEFGRIVYCEDKFLGEEMTQWLVHSNLCRPDIGAETWYAVFVTGRNSLGATFSRHLLEEYVRSICSTSSGRIGPMIQVYTDDAALARARVLEVDGDQISRKKSPIIDTFALPYSAYMLTLLDVFFPGERQVTLVDFKQKTGWFDACLWGEADIEYMLRSIEPKGYLDVDRHIRPWVIERRITSKNAWKNIYNDLA